MITLAETLQAYSDESTWYADHTRDFPAGSSLMSEMKELARLTTGTILDAGTGGGRDARYIASLGRDVIALDMCLPLLRHIEPQTGLSVVNGDVRNLPLMSNSIGGIWCSAVILHLNRDDSRRSLGEFYRVLKPGGILQVAIKEGVGHAAIPMRSSSRFRRHFYYYNTDDLTAFARETGFEVVSTWIETEVLDAEPVQHWAKARLRKPTS
jgi:ubiquinone/menaquinone biosynthesis C-methylase UbiE